MLLVGKKSVDKQSYDSFKAVFGLSILAFCFVLHILWECPGHHIESTDSMIGYSDLTK